MISELPFPRYTRKGQCNRCGWCCLLEDPPCTHLEFIEKGKYNCKIHDKKDRLEKCIVFPGNPPIQNPRCGYWFIDLWENNKMIKAGEGIR